MNTTDVIVVKIDNGWESGGYAGGKRGISL
jgi:hypothetical protein